MIIASEDFASILSCHLAGYADPPFLLSFVGTKFLHPDSRWCMHEASLSDLCTVDLNKSDSYEYAGLRLFQLSYSVQPIVPFKPGDSKAASRPSPRAKKIETYVLK